MRTGVTGPLDGLRVLDLGTRTPDPIDYPKKALEVGRALEAMFATFVLGALVGAMIRKMLDESLAIEEKNISKKAGPPRAKVADR